MDQVITILYCTDVCLSYTINISICISVCWLLLLFAVYSIGKVCNILVTFVMESMDHIFSMYVSVCVLLMMSFGCGDFYSCFELDF